MEKISFSIDDEIKEFYVLDQTMVFGDKYLLVTEEEDGDCDAWVLKLIEDGDDLVYEMVEDDEVLDAVAKLFEMDLEGVELS